MSVPVSHIVNDVSGSYVYRSIIAVTEDVPQDAAARLAMAGRGIGPGRDSLSLDDAEALAKGAYIDPEFPLVPDVSPAKHAANVRWARPAAISEIGTRAAVFVDDVSPCDIRQGRVGDCWLLASIACAGESPPFVYRLFNASGELAGRASSTSSAAAAAAAAGPDEAAVGACPDVPTRSVFEVFLFRMGVRVRVRVDSRFAVDTGGSCFFARCNGPELWMLILEKAFAKMLGPSYRAIHGGYEKHSLQDLTGCPADWLHFGNWAEDKVWEYVTHLLERQHLLTLSSTKTPKHGIRSGHAYSLLQAKQLASGERLVQVRNPWGSGEWTGDWSDKSSLWTPEAEAELGITRAERDRTDGAFWMTVEDLSARFSRMDYCDTRPCHVARAKAVVRAPFGSSQIAKSLTTPVVCAKLPRHGEQRVWVGVHQAHCCGGNGVPYMSFGLTVFAAGSTRPLAHARPGRDRDCWVKIHRCDATDLVIVVTVRGTYLDEFRASVDPTDAEKARQEVNGEEDSPCSDAEKLFSGGGPTFELMMALDTAFWMLDTNLDSVLCRAELDAFLAMLPARLRGAVGKHWKTEQLACYDRVDGSTLTRHGFKALFVDAARCAFAGKGDPSATTDEDATSNAAEILAQFGFTPSLEQVYSRPVVVQVRAEHSQPELRLGSGDASVARACASSRCRNPFASGRIKTRRVPTARQPFWLRGTGAAPSEDTEAEEDAADAGGSATATGGGEAGDAAAAAASGAGSTEAAAAGSGGSGAATLPCPAAFPDGFSPLVDTEPPRDPVAPGTPVRVRRTVSMPLYGWGEDGTLSHGQIGVVTEVVEAGTSYRSAVCKVAFPFEAAATVALSDVQVARFLEPGDFVRIKPGVSPAKGWGEASRNGSYRVVSIHYASNVATLRGPGCDRWKVQVTDLQWEGEDLDVGQLGEGDTVRLADEAAVPHGGAVAVRWGEFGTVTSADKDGRVSVAFASDPEWSGSSTDLERVSVWRPGDAARLTRPVSSASAGDVCVYSRRIAKGKISVLLADGTRETTRYSSISKCADAVMPAACAEERPKLGGTRVQFANQAEAEACGVAIAAVGVVTAYWATKDGLGWMARADFPGVPALECRAAVLRRAAAAFQPSDPVVLSPTLTLPRCAYSKSEEWCASHIPEHGAVGVVREQAVLHSKREDRAGYRVEWPGVKPLLLSHNEIVAYSGGPHTPAHA